MKEHNRKLDPLPKKIKRLFIHNGGIQPHKLYPKEYFWQCWFNEADAKGIAMVAYVKKVSKKEAAHIINYWGFKHVMGELVKEYLDQLNSPEGQTNLAKHTRFIIELRRMCRENGWDVNQILKQL
jgi:hypothetical protein